MRFTQGSTKGSSESIFGGDLKEQFDNLITQNLTFVNFLNDQNQDILNNITPKLFNNFQGYYAIKKKTLIFKLRN